MPSLAIPTHVAAFDRRVVEFRRRQRLHWRLGGLAFLVVFAICAELGDFFALVPVTLTDGRRVDQWIILAGLPRLDEYLARTLPTLRWESLGADVADWFWAWRRWAGLWVETMLIAFMATVFGVVGGFLLSLPAARNLAPNAYALWLSRRALEIARTVPELVWALIFVYCFSVGPLAGVLAIALHGIGALGKLCSEVNENIDMGPLDGVAAAGGDWFDRIRYGAVPQTLPDVISYALIRFEFNVRSSSIIGYVGAGGLGQELRVAMTLQEYTDLSALFLIIFATVIAIDFVSEKLRHQVIGRESFA